MPVINDARTTASIMIPRLYGLRHEECWVLYLNNANKLTGKEKVSHGGSSSTIFDIKTIVRKAVDRTAAGITADGQLILLVADGRGKNGSAGYTLAELSAKLISLGCVSALNLDGGGSSCMVGQAGQVLNAPSDSSGERSVASAIVISELPRE